MKIKKILKIILFVILGFILFNAILLLFMSLGVFVGPETDDGSFTKKFPVKDPKASVCILYRDTEFKKTLAHALADDLNARGIQVITDNVSNRGRYSPGDFDAMVLLSEVMRFSPIPEVTSYIKKHDYPRNIIYFVTWEAFFIPYGLQLDKKRVDAVSSASTMTDRKVFEQARNSILEKISNLLN
jgi:hypothetical protein